jgi:hypothetical protein
MCSELRLVIGLFRQSMRGRFLVRFVSTIFFLLLHVETNDGEVDLDNWSEDRIRDRSMAWDLQVVNSDIHVCKSGLGSVTN